MRTGFFLIIAIWAAISCQEIKDCELDSSRDYAIVGFYEADSADQYEKTVAFSKIHAPDYDFYAISTITDTTTSDDTISVTGLYLYSEEEIITYAFETDSIDYQLTIEYTPHLRIYYDECDPVYSYKIDTAYSDEFDSVAVIFKPLDDFQTEYNLEVYF